MGRGKGGTGPEITLQSDYKLSDFKLCDKDHMSELWIKHRNERDLRSCKVT